MPNILNNIRVWMVQRRMPAREINRVSAMYLFLLGVKGQ